MDRSVKSLEIKSKNYSKLKKVLQSSFELLDRSERLFTKEDSNKKIDGLFLRSQKALTQADSKISDLSTQNVLLKKLFDDLSSVSDRINNLADHQIDDLISSNKKAFLLMESLFKNYSDIQNDTKAMNSILKRSMEINSKFDSGSILAEKKVNEQQQHLNHMLKLSEKVLSLNSKSKTEIKANIFQRLFKVFWL